MSVFFNFSGNIVSILICVLFYFWIAALKKRVDDADRNGNVT